MRVCSCLVLFLTIAGTAHACPGCDPNPGFSVSDEIAGADIALVVEWVRAAPADIDAGLPGETEYAVVHVLRDTTGTIAKGDPVEVPRHRAGAQQDRFLLLGAADGMLRWSSPLPVSASAQRYVAQLPDQDAMQVERLRFFARHFEHDDPFIADDAYVEFAAARYEDVMAVADEFEPEQLRRWLSDDETLPMRLGLYGLLLGRRGGGEDAEFMKRIIVKPTDDIRVGLEGIISGYLLLTGAEGLEVIDDSKLRDSNVAFSETYAAMQALRIMWTYTDGVISKERLRASMRILLDRPELADLVITDLGRWQDWSVVDRLMEMYGAEEYNIPSIKRTIVRYFLIAERSEGEHVAGVRKHLEQLRRLDPDIVEQAERYYLLY